MTWSPTYCADFTKLIVRQLLAFVQRDSRAALDWVSGTPGQPLGFQSYQEAGKPMPQFPAVLIAPMRSVFDPESHQSRYSTTGYYCGARAVHQNADVVSELLQDYVRALDAIFMSLPLSDFYSTWPLTLPTIGTVNTTPLAAGTVKELFVVSHDYDEIRQTQKNAFHFAAALEIHIEREEV